MHFIFLFLYSFRFLFYSLNFSSNFFKVSLSFFIYLKRTKFQQFICLHFVEREIYKLFIKKMIVINTTNSSFLYLYLIISLFTLGIFLLVTCIIWIYTKLITLCCSCNFCVEYESYFYLFVIMTFF